MKIEVIAKVPKKAKNLKGEIIPGKYLYDAKNEVLKEERAVILDVNEDLVKKRGYKNFIQSYQHISGDKDALWLKITGQEAPKEAKK